MSRQMRLVDLVPGAPGDIVVTGLTADSRAVKPGDAFFAIGGFGTHGLRFAAQAKEAGAAVVLFEPPAPADLPPPPDAIAVPRLRSRMGEMGDQFHGRPSHAMTMVGVTGTSGKTSTVQLLAQALKLLGVDSGTIGTLGVGRHGDVVATGYTTPMVLEMHAMLGGLHDDGVQAVAMEVSSHALDQGRVDAVHYDVAVFTNLTRDHLDYHGDMASYGAAKAKLFQRKGLRAAVLNLDDPFGRELAGMLPQGAHAIGTSSRGGQADVRAENPALGGDGIAFDLVLGDERRSLRSPLLGRFNIDNLLAVAGALHPLGHGVAAIAAVLPPLAPIPGRMNRLGGGERPLVVVDYSHKPDALKQALDSLKGHLEGRLICVFGCGGERDTGKRPQMAAIAERTADLVMVTDDNPRREDGDAIVEDIVAGFSDPGRVLVERDRRRAIARAIAGARRGDIVLVAGKGHETYQEVAGVKHPFDDREVAAEALAEWQPGVRA